METVGAALAEADRRHTRGTLKALRLRFIQLGKMVVELDKDAKARAVKAIQKHFEERRDEEIGNLEAQFLLDLLLEQVGPAIYNRAIRDAQALMQDKLVDLDGELFEPEPSEPR